MARHANLIQSMSEFYTLIVQLASIQPSLLKVPEQSNTINGAVALEAGFTQEVVSLIAQIPYLAVTGRTTFDIMPSTVPVNYFASRDKLDFEALRYMDDDPENNENMIPGWSLRLSEPECLWHDINLQ